MAAPAESAELAELIRAAFEEYRGKLEPESGALGETGETIAAAFADHTVIAAETGGRLVGCVLATRQGDSLYLGRLAVHPEFRHDGIASRLLAEAERLARATGATALTVGVRIALPDNVRYFVARTASARSAARRIPASTTRPRSTWPSGWIRGWIIRETKTSRDRGQKIHCHGEPGGPRLDA